MKGLLCVSVPAKAHVCEYVGVYLGSPGEISNSEINDLKLFVCCGFQLSGFLVQHGLVSSAVCAWRISSECTWPFHKANAI